MQIRNVRFIIAAITTFSAYAVYVSRVNLSIAIIAMVEDGHQTHSASGKQLTMAADKLARPAADTGAVGPQLVAESRPALPIASSLTAPPSDSVDGNSSSNGQTQPPFIRSYVASSISSANNSLSAAAAATADQQDGQQLHREPLTTIFPASKKSVKTPLISQEKFHWDQFEQGHILGAFFYGYILFQIPGARMAESVGAKWIIMAANAGSALISLIFPLSTQLNSIHLLMALRFVMGLCQSAFFPAAYVLFCRWLPERERSVLLPIMFIGSNMGSVSTYIMSSYLISSGNGWPSVFYLSGLICTIVTVLFYVFGSDRPEDNWLITDEEIEFIKLNVTNQTSVSNSLSEFDPKQQTCDEKLLNESRSDKETPFRRRTNSIAIETSPAFATSPTASLKRRANDDDDASNGGGSLRRQRPELSWCKLLGSMPIWVLILSMYGNEWSNVVLCFELPSYLNTALGFPIEQNGVINSFFQLSFTLASPVMSSLGAYMLDRHVFGMHKIHVRKLFQSLATFGQLACFVSVPICGANRGLIIMFMFSAIVLKSCANAGDIMVSSDLSPEFAGTIFAFANSIGNTAGFFVPLLTGAFVRDPYDREQWTPFWMTTAAIMGSSGLIFLVFGETRRQDYAAESDDDDDEDEPLETLQREVGAKTKDAPPKFVNGNLLGGQVAPALGKKAAPAKQPLVRLSESAV